MRLTGMREALASLGLAVVGCAMALGQGGGAAELHASSSVTATTVGLPAYPGAKLYKDASNDPQADIGLTFGDFHFRLVVASYAVDAPGAQILDFYRKPLAQYGDVLECENGKPVGALKVARSGLTCNDDVDSGDKSKGSSGVELRAGTPQKYRIVALGDVTGKQTRFALLLLETPKQK